MTKEELVGLMNAELQAGIDQIMQSGLRGFTTISIHVTLKGDAFLGGGGDQTRLSLHQQDASSAARTWRDFLAEKYPAALITIYDEHEAREMMVRYQRFGPQYPCCPTPTWEQFLWLAHPAFARFAPANERRRGRCDFCSQRYVGKPRNVR